MLVLKLETRYSKQWFVKDDCFVTGHLFVGGDLLRDESLANWFASKGVQDAWPDAVREGSGFFSAVCRRGDTVMAAADRVRSLPLFYGVKGGDFFLSDDAHWVRQQVGDQDMDPLAADEMMLVKYVTGSDTLYPNVKQLRAGECLIARQTTGAPLVTTSRYYRYVHHDYIRDSNDEAFIEQMHQMHLAIGQHLVDFAGGRTIVVPLSGGYDSRLLAAILKWLKYDNVRCFSYGRPGCRESETSRQVAEKLGFKWLFAPYTTGMWFQLFHSPEKDEYYRFADNLSVIPHVQDWPAVRQFRLDKAIPADSIFAPGHCYDFPPGSLVPKPFLTMKTIGPEGLVEVNWDAHYRMHDPAGFSEQTRQALKRKMLGLIGDIPCQTTEEAVNAFECWVWQERVAKFVLNSLRVYELHGYSWCIPFWYKEVTDFWERIPLEYRLNKRIHQTYMNRVNAEFSLPDRWRPGGRHRGRIRRIAEALGLLGWARYRIARREYDGHPLAYYGIMSRDVFNEYFVRTNRGGFRGLNSYLVAERLGRAPVDRV